MSEEVKKRRKWGFFKICLVAVILVAGIIGGLYLWGNYRIDMAEKTVSAYLQKKYNREFVVTNGHYIWATGTYTFDAYAKDDPELKFPAFAGFRLYENGIGDMYKQAWMGREAHKLLDPFVDEISKNNCYGAMYGPGMHGSDPEWKKVMLDIYRNNLTPLQAAEKYPGKIYLNTGISYALDVTPQNKEEIFKKVFALVEFLRKSGFGYMEISMGFYPSNIFKNKPIKQAYKENPSGFKNNIFQDLTYRINIKTENLSEIQKWQDIGKFVEKKIKAEIGVKYKYYVDKNGYVFVKDEISTQNSNIQRKGE